MSGFAIRATGLGKRYDVTLGPAGMPGVAGYRTLREGLSRLARAPLALLGRRGPAPEGFWALREASFEVPVGQAVGIIGRNGAGKSTLLKVLSRVTRPSAGEVELRGRVGSLLEVGTGFHPELTGRENIALNAAVLGMTAAELRERFDAIVEFSEVARFLDVPVKRYSSGMYIRLAFGVAAHLQPELLLIDEVLAVGDAAFQRKCLGKMDEKLREGRTVLFVSHNMAALERLCTRAIWIDGGRIVQDGPVGQVVDAYLKTSFTPATERRWDEPSSAPGGEELRLLRASIAPLGGTPRDPISIRTPFVIEIEYANLKPGAAITPNVELSTERGEVVFRSAPIHEPHWQGRPMPAGRYRSRCQVPGDLLNDGSHHVRVIFRQNEGLVVAEVENALTLDVREDVSMRGACNGRWPGAVRPALPWSTELLDEQLPRGS